jgi:hypothetical protein
MKTTQQLDEVHKCANILAQNKMKDGSSNRALKAECLCLVFHKPDLKTQRNVDR